ncbi:MAG TPA: ABC transporter permease [Oligoflexia bacterium]|nr:ABC transporter permease [Oligoflexia bacterium]
MKRLVPSIRGVFSVWLRYAFVFRKTWLLNCAAPMSEPVVYLLAFGLGLTPLVRSLRYAGNEVDYLRFIAPGMIAIGVMFQGFFEGAYGSFVRLRFQRTWQAMLTTPLCFADIFWGELLWAATKGFLAGVITSLVALLWGVYSLRSFAAGVPVILCGSILFAALGMATAGFAKTISHINLPIHLFIVPMFVVCGTYFPRDNLPEAVAAPAGLLPLSGLVDLLRWEIGPDASVLIPISVIAVWTAGLIAIAWQQLERKVFR